MRAPSLLTAALGRAVADAVAVAAAAASAASALPARVGEQAGLAARRLSSAAAAGSCSWPSSRAGCAVPTAFPTTTAAARAARPPARLAGWAAGPRHLASRGYAADAAPIDEGNPTVASSSGGRAAGPAPPRCVGASSLAQPSSSPRPPLRPPRRGGGADGGAGAHAATAWRSRGGAGGPLAFLAKSGSARPKRPAVEAAAAVEAVAAATSAALSAPRQRAAFEAGEALPYPASAALDAEEGDEGDEDDDAAAASAWADCGPAFPFTARAFYVGRRAEGCLARLRSTAAAEGLATVWDEPSSVMFRLGPAEGSGAEEVGEAGAHPLPPPGGAAQAAQAGGAAAADDNAGTPGLAVTDQYVAVFAPMGAVVFFNTPGGGGDAEAALWARLTAGGRLTCGEATHADDVRLLVAPGLDAPTRVAGDALILRHPGTSVIKTVACVAAQTVALHFYEAQVDADLERFRGANASMAATGSFKAGTSKEALLKAVARNNVLMATIMGGGAGAAADPYTGAAGAAGRAGGAKKKKAAAATAGAADGGVDGRGWASSSSPALADGGGGGAGSAGPAAAAAGTRGDAIGIMSRLDVAWHDPTCAAVYDHLRDDLEIDGRLATLGAKLTFVQDNLKYFLEIMQNKKSDTLEWTIIVLIAAEIGVSLYDLFFKGAG